MVAVRNSIANCEAQDIAYEQSIHIGQRRCTAGARHQQLKAWVTQIATLTQPDRIYWADGSPGEYDRICAEMVATGTLIRQALGILLDVVNVVCLAAAGHEHHRPIRDSGEIIICADATSQPSTSARVSNRHIPFNDLRRFAFKII